MVHGGRREDHICVDDLRIVGIEGEVDGPGVVIFVENFLPVCAAVSGTEDAAFGVRAVGMAENGDEDAIGILRIDDDGGDLLAVAQAEVSARFFRRRWICKCRRRRKDRAGASLRRCRHR